jgi:hypothetical protein
MKTYFIIEYFNILPNIWIRHNYIKYKTLQMAKNEVKRFKEHGTNDKLRVIKIQTVYEK